MTWSSRCCTRGGVSTHWQPYSNFFTLADGWGGTVMRLTMQVMEKGSYVGRRVDSRRKVLSSWKSFSVTTRTPPPLMSTSLQGKRCPPAVERT